jgi:hypothetical protein
MKALSLAAILAAMLLLATSAQALTPQRAQGIFMHMLPMRVAELGGKKWGLVVAHAPNRTLNRGPRKITNAE